MSNSSLATYRRITTHRNSPRNHEKDTISIHYMAGHMTAKACADYFAETDRDVSSNYTIGDYGDIAISVDEDDRSWCTASPSNDHRAITIEVSSDADIAGKVTDEAYEALIKLCADICERNGIKKLVWSNSKSDRVNHKNGCNMTVHRDFINTGCPGEYLFSRMGQIAEAVNELLGAEPEKTATKETEAKKTIYRVRKAWTEAKTQKGAFSVLANAKKCADENAAYKVFDESGKVVYAPAEKKKSYYEIACEVIAGKWGNGNTRKQKLTAAGYDYATVQSLVNKILYG